MIDNSVHMTAKCNVSNTWWFDVRFIQVTNLIQEL